MKRLLVFTVTALAPLLIFSVEPTFAWESDFHYGLTKWLAIQTGFSRDDAERVAQGTLNMDEGINDARYLVLHYACLSRDLQASQHVRDAHFPSFAELPAPAKSREVTAGSDAASREARKEIELPGGDRNHSLSKFGETLHPLEDSWSHQGVPGIPWLCNSDLSWGHPDARGGWNRHEADFTYLWVTDTIAAAQATFQLMQAYLEKRAWPRSDKSWDSIKSEVEKFAGLKTKAEKQAWFAERGFANFDFLKEVSIPDGEQAYAYSARLTRVPTRDLPAELKELTGREVPEEVKAFYRKFFSAWISERDYKKLLARFVDTAAVTRTLAQESRGKGAITQEMVAARFWIWRLRDHGRASEFGHGIPLPSKQQLLNYLLYDFPPKELTAFESTDEALVPLGKEAPPYLVIELPSLQADKVMPGQKEARYAALARFKNAPHDVVMVIASKIKNAWRIISLTWAIDH